MKDWVVFSDLHVSEKSVDTCIDVLKKVHSEAVERGARIAFLGDFWERRGVLPVGALNRVLEEIKGWTCQSVWIAGNHDQVDLGGKTHGLDVIGAANRYAKIISEPTELNGALWIPYRRTKQEVLDAWEGRTKRAKIILCHIDVVGAWMNDAIQSGVGILPDELPQDIDILTGHYHKPHSVKDTRVTYIGSPWEVSAHEADQNKRLMVYSGKWEKIEDIPIDIGPKHWVGRRGSSGLKEAEAGDRVVLRGTAELLDSLQDQIQEAEGRGVAVTIYAEAEKRPEARIAGAADLPSVQLAKEYASIHGFDSDRLVELVTKHQGEVAEKLSAAVTIDEVVLNNFGPFFGEHKISWGKRGVTFVDGAVENGSSNGSGKTTLIYAPVWALTGETDPRPLGSSRKGLTKEMISDGQKSSSVVVTGSVSGRPFKISREVKKANTSLQFLLDGVNMTQQDTKMTQSVINDHLRTDLLIPAGWQSQHTEQSVLEMTDTAAKSRLGALVDLSVWRDCHAEAAMLRKDAEQSQLRLSGSVEAKLYELNKAEASISQVGVDEWEKGRQKSLLAAKEKIQKLQERRKELAVPYDIGELKKKLKIESMHTAELAEAIGDEALAKSQVDKLLAEQFQCKTDGTKARQDLNLKKESAEAGVCHACGQKTEPEGAQEAIIQATQKLSDAADRWRKVSSDIEQARQKAASAEIKLMKARESDRERRDFVQKMQEQLSESREIETQIALVDGEIVAEKKVLRSIEDQENPIVAIQKREAARAKELAADIAEEKSKLAQLKVDIAQLKVCEAACGNQGIPAYIIETTLDSLCERMSSYLDVLSDGRLMVSLSATSTLKSGKMAEKISRTIKVKKGSEYVERDIRSLSGGQRRRCALASHLAYVELAAERSGVSISSMVMDEVTQHLDPEGRRAVLDAARGLGRETVWVISHDSDLADLASSVVMIKQKAGSSKIIDGGIDV